jgi:hypothetical protein
MRVEACSMTGTARTATQVEHLERSAMSRPKDLEPTAYEIRLAGHLDVRRAARFEGLSMRHEVDGITVLSGPIADQAALHGVIQQLRDLGLPLVSVSRAEPESSTPGGEAGSTHHEGDPAN